VRDPVISHPRRQVRPLSLLLLALLLVQTPVPARSGDSPVHGFRVVESWPHDPQAFTQGLVMVEGELYESTGGYGSSSLRRVRVETGEAVQQRDLPRRLFGEGLTAWRGVLVQLTWRAGVGLRYEQATFAPLGEFEVDGEGWGITQDGDAWIMSDGSATLRFLDPDTGAESKRLRVQDDGAPIRQLNELEMVPVPVDGGGTRAELWANIWHQDRLVRINPADGRVLGYVDLGGLWPRQQRPHREAVLNGIAWDARGKRLLVTGKHWPRLYWIEVPGLLPVP
jgi:glutamine cyclotransferase